MSGFGDLMPNSLAISTPTRYCFEVTASRITAVWVEISIFEDVYRQFVCDFAGLLRLVVQRCAPAEWNLREIFRFSHRFWREILVKFSVAHPNPGKRSAENFTKISRQISRHLWQRKTEKNFTSALLQGSCSEVVMRESDRGLSVDPVICIASAPSPIISSFRAELPLSHSKDSERRERESQTLFPTARGETPYIPKSP